MKAFSSGPLVTWILRGGHIRKLGSNWPKKKRDVTGHHGHESSAGNSGFFKPMRINHHSSPQVGSTQESYILKRFPGEPGLLSVCRPNDLNYIGSHVNRDVIFVCVTRLVRTAEFEPSFHQSFWWCPLVNTLPPHRH